MERDEVEDITGLNINKNRNNSFVQSRFDAHLDIIAFFNVCCIFVYGYKWSVSDISWRHQRLSLLSSHRTTGLFGSSPTSRCL